MENQVTNVETTERKRGGCLTAFLILMLIANPLTGIYYLLAGSTIRQTFPNFPDWAGPLFGVMALANFVFAIAIWKWKKWGVYGFVASAAVAFLVNVISIGFLGALVGLIGLVILAFLLRPVWNQME